MKTVGEMIELLSRFPSESRLMIGDSYEGTIRDVDGIRVLPKRYVDKNGFGRNNQPVIEIEVTKTDEFWENRNIQKNIVDEMWQKAEPRKVEPRTYPHKCLDCGMYCSLSDDEPKICPNCRGPVESILVLMGGTR